MNSSDLMTQVTETANYHVGVRFQHMAELLLDFKALLKTMQSSEIYDLLQGPCRKH